MDDRVAGLSRALAVRTLQLQMEYIYGCIEDEALDIAQSKNTGVLLIRWSCLKAMVSPGWTLASGHAVDLVGLLGAVAAAGGLP